MKNENVAVREMRKHAAWYLKGVKGNANARKGINDCETREDVVSLLYGLVDELKRRNKIFKWSDV